MKDKTVDRRALSVLFGLVALGVYLIGFQYKPSGDMRPNELLPITLLKEGNLDFNEFVPAGAPLPLYFVRVGERIVSFYPIVPGLMNVPAHLVASWLGWVAGPRVLAKWTSAIVAAVSVAVMYLVLLNICMTWRGAALITSVYAFATCVWSVAANGLWQHGPSLLFLNCALLLLVSPRTRWLPLAGLFLGLAIFNRPTNAVLALPLMVYVAVNHRRRVLPFAATMTIPLAAMAIYSHVYLGSVLALGQPPRWEGTHGPLTMGFHGLLFADLAALLFSPGRGLFVFSPIFLFSVAGLIWIRAKPIYPYLAAGALAHLIVFAKWDFWWGGWSFGYRMLIEMIPALTIFLALAWDKLVSPRLVWRTMFWTLAAVSLYIHFLGAFFYPSGWNGTPENIDRNPQRVWQVRDTELRRCQQKFIDALEVRLLALRFHVTFPWTIQGGVTPQPSISRPRSA